MNGTGYPRPDRSGPARVVPLLGWLRHYERATLRHDLIAGLTVAVMLVPQSMAYAALAGMPPVTGLYASIVPLLVYALLGTSGSLAVGPVAITALMTGAALAPLADGDPTRYAALAGLLALLVGVIQVLMGVLRLGVLVNFMSHSVLSGFTSAAAIVIAASQVKDLLGLDAGRAETFPEIAGSLWRSATTVHGVTVLVSLVSVAGLVLLRRYVPKLPGALLVVAGVTVVSAAFSLGTRGVEILTEVPGGLPAPALPTLAGQDVRALLPAAVAIALVAYMEGIAVAKALAARTRQHVNPNQELTAVGSANVAAGIFQAFPVAGGFSRSAVNFSAGARTPLATVFTALMVALTALFLTPAFHHLPKAVLAAIVVVAVLGLIDRRAAVTAWRTRRSDGLTLALTFLVTLMFGVEPGLAAGVAFSLSVFLWRSARPHLAELGRVPDTDTYRNLDRYAGLVTDPRIAIVRVDGPLYFANAQLLEDRLLALAEQRDALEAVVLDASAISDTDVDGAHAVAELHQRLAARGVALHLATVRGPVRDLLARAGVWQPVYAAGHVHRDVTAALAAVGGPPGPAAGPQVAPASVPQEVL
ncbi:sulfate permease, SulP family [Micromonospora phaseoli]|uniref:Sulfate permease, SulP family n=1 Tax=Micromonospora phaseoli TaxID=1144548 RepID=A0A1H6V8T5_9ACTN|nr:sulfate permease [Micromonospora phaseoli]PZV93685.1 SulP family sulfate permease [Micromonospora phaseoli]GIJ79165.1 sodium-independent anion transporter [Micromonospora phaseoli]SEJ00236.1 sulfate permease, SulP family [Micromonospora phaseoli]